MEQNSMIAYNLEDIPAQCHDAARVELDLVVKAVQTYADCDVNGRDHLRLVTKNFTL